jgi:hypothetical protein
MVKFSELSARRLTLTPRTPPSLGIVFSKGQNLGIFRRFGQQHLYQGVLITSTTFHLDLLRPVLV